MMKQTMGFYEEIAEEYDLMIRFRERMDSETAMLQKWVDRYGFKSVVDVACGTGLHAIALAKMGLEVVGADLSEKMLQQAQVHAQEFGASVSWIHASMTSIRQHLSGNYGAVLCLGNSLPHILTKEELDKVVENFSQLLRPGGIAVVQMLNYHRVLAEQERVFGIRREGSTEFIRFYDFLPDQTIRFNLLTVHWQENKATHTLNSTILYPYQRHELEPVFQRHDFHKLEYYGNMAYAPFEEDTSPNLVVVGRKAKK